MPRTSDKHAPRRDDQLAHEEQALVHGAPDEGRTEPRRSEAPGPGEGGVGARPEVEEPAGDAGPQSEIEGRAALAATFRPTTFPARRDQLVEEARAGSPTTRSSPPWSGLRSGSTRLLDRSGTRSRGNDISW
jgi:hypothetical protein